MKFTKKAFDLYPIIYEVKENLNNIRKEYQNRFGPICYSTIFNLVKKLEQEKFLKRRLENNIDKLTFTPKGKKLYLKLKKVKSI